MKIIALFSFAGILFYHAGAAMQTQPEARFLSGLENALKAEAPEVSVNKMVLPPGVPVQHLDSGKPLLSPRGKWSFYELKSRRWTGSISVFYGDSQLDASNHITWLLRDRWSKAESPREPIGDKTYQMVSYGWAQVMSRKANICISVHIKPVDSPNEDKSTSNDAKTAESIDIALKFTKRIIDQAPAN